MKPTDFLKKVKDYTFVHFVSAGFFNGWSDEKFLRMLFKRSMGYELDLDNPQTFNEKLQWLKLRDKKPLYTTLVDKYEVKKYVADKIGEEYIIPTLGIWDSVDEIDFDSLPEQFVLKCTHDSGGVIVCRDKSKLDIAAAKERLRKRLKVNYYYLCREWPYKDVKPRIIAEKYMEDFGHSALPVYKIFCFDGKPEIIQAITNDKQKNESIDYFDTDWNKLELRQNFPNSPEPLPKPVMLDEMLKLAEKLSAGFSFIRIDLYCINGKTFFSEFTFFSDAGLTPFVPDKWDRILGDRITLPEETE